jgi:hypothetical protein
MYVLALGMFMMASGIVAKHGLGGEAVILALFYCGGLLFTGYGAYIDAREHVRETWSR